MFLKKKTYKENILIDEPFVCLYWSNGMQNRYTKQYCKNLHSRQLAYKPIIFM